MTTPDIEVDVRDDRLEAAELPFVIPFGAPLAALPTAAGFRDHGVGFAVAGAGLDGPRVGNASSDWVSSEAFDEAVPCGPSRAGCFPAALADNVGSVVGTALCTGSLEAAAGVDSVVCAVLGRSSSGVSSIVGLCQPCSSAACCCMSLSAADTPSPAALPFVAVSLAIFAA